MPKHTVSKPSIGEVVEFVVLLVLVVAIGSAIGTAVVMTAILIDQTT